MRVLEGVRVLDLSIAMSGPFAAMKLGDLGADVIKVEPLTGEWQRHAAAGGATGKRVNASFLSLNRNKRSLSVDLKSEAGLAALHRLVATADVFLQNYRPGVAERLGLDYETLRAIRPDLVYVSISGYGASGPYARRPGQDLLLQAMSGALFSAGRPGEAPVAAPYFLVDAFAAYSAFEGALAALFHRQRTYGIYPTSDGYLALSFAEPAALARLLDEPGLAAFDAERDGFARREEISTLVEGRLRTGTTGHWLEVLGEAGVWCGPVYDYDALLEDPQVRHNGSFVTYDHPTEGRVTTPGFPFRLAASPPEVVRPAPLNGQHSREVLREAGLGEEEVARLEADGVIRSGDPA